MNNTGCKYYNIDKEYCPFDYSCDEDCYFVYKKAYEDREDYDELQSEFDIYRSTTYNTITDLENEIEDLQDEIDNLEDKVEDLEDQQKADYMDTDLYKKQCESIRSLQNYAVALEQRIKGLLKNKEEDECTKKT